MSNRSPGGNINENLAVVGGWMTLFNRRFPVRQRQELSHITGFKRVARSRKSHLVIGWSPRESWTVDACPSPLLPILLPSPEGGELAVGDDRYRTYTRSPQFMSSSVISRKPDSIQSRYVFSTPV